MAQTVNESRPQFSRLTESRRTSSWKAAIPAVAFVVALIAGLAWFASRSTSLERDRMVAQNEAQTSREAAEKAQKQSVALLFDNNVLMSAGRTTVVLEAPAAPAKQGRGKAKSAESDSRAQGWAAATWGEAEPGKSFIKLNAYGLKAAPNGQAYLAWFQPKTGDPVAMGRLEPGTDGSAALLAKSLPAFDQGKAVMVSLQAADAKAPEAPLLSAQLPELKSTLAPAAAASAAPATPATAETKPATPAQ